MNMVLMPVYDRFSGGVGEKKKQFTKKERNRGYRIWKG